MYWGAGTRGWMSIISGKTAVEIQETLMEDHGCRGKFGKEKYRKQTRKLTMKWAWFHSNNVLVLHQEKGYCLILFLMFIHSYVYWAPATQTLSKH